MEEILDIYNQNKKITERKHIRGNNTLRENEYVLVVEIALINLKNQILLAKRSENKKNNPLKWETTQGSVKSGESSLKGAVREIQEELGIKIQEKELKHIKTIRDENEHIFKDLFLLHKDMDEKELSFTDGEVINAKWFSMSEFEEMRKRSKLSSNMNFNSEIIKKYITDDRFIIRGENHEE